MSMLKRLLQVLINIPRFAWQIAGAHYALSKELRHELTGIVRYVRTGDDGLAHYEDE